MPAAPYEDDVKVAGVPQADGLAEAPAQGGTASFPSFADHSFSDSAGEPPRPGPMGAGGPVEARDEIGAGPARPARAGRQSGRSRAPRRIGGGSGAPGGSGGAAGAARRTGVKIAVVAVGAAVVVGGGAVAAFAFTGDSGGDDKATVQSAPLADAAAAAPPVDPKVMEAERRKKALDRASRAVRKGGGVTAKKPVLQPKGTPIPTKKPEDEGGSGSGGAPVGGDPIPAGEAQQIAKGMLPSYGFGGSGQFGCLVKLWNRESGWRTNAANPSGAYGIPQALPGSKMSSAGSDWRTSARTQIKWGLGYIKGRYSNPCGAWSHSESSGWY